MEFRTGISPASMTLPGCPPEHALEYEYERLRQQRTKFNTFPGRGDKEMTAPFVPQSPRHGQDTQSVRIGLDHRAASRLRRCAAQGAVVFSQRIQIDCQDAW